MCLCVLRLTHGPKGSVVAVVCVSLCLLRLTHGPKGSVVAVVCVCVCACVYADDQVSCPIWCNVMQCQRKVL